MYSVFPAQPPANPSEQTENTRPSTTVPTTVPTDILGDDEDVKQEQQIAKAVLKIIECVGEDPNREGLRYTPERYAEAMLWFTKGYTESVEGILNGAIFNEECHDLVVVKDIDISSLCEHHLIPFTGKMHIGYYPKGRIVGLSKLARVAEMFSRRFQVQERLTKQVADAIFDVLKPNGVAVILESSHLCMSMRGIQKVGSTTTTRCVLGCMQSTYRWNEFVALLNRQ